MSRNDPGTGAVLLLTTTGNEESALALSRTLVCEGLAACVTRSAVQSVYRWEPAAAGTGEGSSAGATAPICEEGEVLLVIKTARERVAEVEARLLAIHPYECPEVVVVEPVHVEAKYLAWLLGSCSKRV